MNCRATGRRVALTPALRKDIARIERIWSKGRQAHSGSGPWLFGGFSIADCLFAPVAFRFETYGISLSEAVEDYRRSVLNHESMREWLEHARNEPETIEAEEVGT